MLTCGTSTTADLLSEVNKNIQYREALEALYKAQGYNNVFFFADGFTYTELNDVGIYEDGTAWTYADAGALPVTIAAGTVPSEGVYKSVKVVLPPFETVAEMEAATYLSTLAEDTEVNWGGYFANGDGGGNSGLLKFGAHTADGGSVFSIDASTYIKSSFNDQSVSARKFGVMAGSGYSDRIQAAFDSDLSIDFDNVEYIVDRKITKSTDSHVNWNNCKINGAEITDTATRSVLEIKGNDSILALPAMSGNLLFSDRTVAFSSDHNLSVGDWFLIYNPNNYSYSPARSGYKAGEYLQVANIVSDTEVTITGTILSDTGYSSADCELYKVNNTRFSFEGAVEVIAPNTSANIRAISLSHTLDTDISNFKGVAIGSVIGIVISHSINVSGINVVGEQSGLVGVDYGVAVVSSQYVYLNGRFTGRRHGFTTAEQDAGDVGVVNRCMEIGGYFASYEPDLASADTHGNTEYLTFTGVINGGVNLRGNHLSCHAKVFADESGRCIQFSELVGYDFDISGSYLYGSNKTSAWGVISSAYSASSVSYDYAETVGGLLNMKDVTIDAPNADLLISILKRTSETTNVKVDLRGLTIVNSMPNPLLRFVDSTVNGRFEYLNLTGISGLGSELLLSHTNVSKVIAKVKGKASITTDGDNRALSTVTYGISFGIDYTPTPYATLGTSGSVPTSGGSTFIIPFASPAGATTSQAFIGYGSSDNSNMTAGTSRDINWFAE